jgi:formate hydrogenlyase transcriptional activator
VRRLESPSLLALLGALADAIGRAHAFPALTQAISDALATHSPTRLVEIAICREGPTGFESFLHSSGSPSVSRTFGDPSESLPHEVLVGGTRVIALDARPAGKGPELSRARASNASHLAALRLEDGDGVAGVLLLALAAPGPPDVDVLTAIARLVTAAVRHVQVVGRVANLSRQAHAEREQLREELSNAVLPGDVVASSPAMRALFRDVLPLVARRDTTVLLRGESGAGKEIIARRVHALSPRAARPFLKVNCGAIPDALVESTLFGHERGAFTGATNRHVGLFERANGGTLLLDEVAELPPSAQVKVLRVLQEGEFERVGGESTQQVDVRVIAATHRNLEALIARESFRADLFYRLNVFPILVPPLRDRPEDLEALTLSILDRIARRFGRRPPRISAATLAQLRSHRWPGNVRELENVLERAMVLQRGDELVLPPDFDGTPHAADTDRQWSNPETFESGVRRVLQAALAAADGRLYGPDGAAARLGLKPTTLQSKLRRYGLKPRRG